MTAPDVACCPMLASKNLTTVRYCPIDRQWVPRADLHALNRRLLIRAPDSGRHAWGEEPVEWLITCVVTVRTRTDRARDFLDGVRFVQLAELEDSAASNRRSFGEVPVTSFVEAPVTALVTPVAASFPAWGKMRFLFAMPSSG